MRDIREDLRKRLGALGKERDELEAQIKAKLEEINLYEQQLSALLAFEEKRAQDQGVKTKKGTPETAAAHSTASLTDDDFEADILGFLGDGKVWEHAKIKQALEGKEWKMKGKTSLGRHLHGTLMSLRTRGFVENVGAGRWKKIKRSATAA